VLTPEVATCFGVTALVHAGIYLLNALLPLHVVALGGSKTQVGLLFTVSTMTSMVLRPLVGGWNDHWGFRRVALPGAVALVAATAGLWLAGAPGVVVALMAGIGLGNALVSTSAGVHVAAVATPVQRGEALSLYYVATSLGCAVGPPVGFLLYRWYGIGAVFGAALAALAVTGGLAARVGGGPRPAAERPPGTFRVLSPPAVPVSVALVLVTLGHSSLYAFLPLYALASGRGDALGWFFTLYSAWVIGCRFALRGLSDRLGRTPVAATAMGCTALGYAILAIPPTALTLLAGALLLGTGAALLYPTLVALLVDRVPEAERGLALGTLSAFWDVGAAGGALLIGLTVERTSYAAGFLLGAATAVLGLGAFWAVERRHIGRRDLPRPAAGVSF
jgi:MFS family permease